MLFIFLMSSSEKFCKGFVSNNLKISIHNPSLFRFSFSKLKSINKDKLSVPSERKLVDFLKIAMYELQTDNITNI